MTRVDLLQKLLTLDRRIIYALVFVCVVAPFYMNWPPIKVEVSKPASGRLRCHRCDPARRQPPGPLVRLRSGLGGRADPDGGGGPPALFRQEDPRARHQSAIHRTGGGDRRGDHAPDRPRVRSRAERRLGVSRVPAERRHRHAADGRGFQEDVSHRLLRHSGRQDPSDGVRPELRPGPRGGDAGGNGGRRVLGGVPGHALRRRRC